MRETIRSSSDVLKATFNYVPLEHEDSIRLLIVEPAPRVEDGLRVSLKHVRIAENPSYEAISYTWGEKTPSAQLQTADGELPVTKTLPPALRRFRLKNAARSLWADSVCINQNDKEEKARQLGIMGEIYKRAEKVLIWLGEETKNTGPAMEYMLNLTERYGYATINQTTDSHWWRMPPTLKSDIDVGSDVLKQAKERRIDDLYAREWFTRLWIVQEVVLGQKPVLQCGTHRLDWAKFGSAITFLKAASNTAGTDLDNKEAFNRAYTIHDIRTHYQDIDKIQPTLIVSNYHHFGIYMYKLKEQNCTEDHDRVYALLGLRPWFFDVSEKKMFQIKPDYEKPVFDVYREWALELMGSGDFNFLLDAGIWTRKVHSKSGDLEFFSGNERWKKGYWTTSRDRGKAGGEKDESDAEPLLRLAEMNLSDDSPLSETRCRPGISELPSWVPDLRNTSKTSSSLPWLNVHGRGGFCARSRPGLGSIQFAKWEASHGDFPRKVWVKGVLFDTFMTGMAIHEWDDSQDCSRLQYIRTITEGCEVLFDNFAAECEDPPWPLMEMPESVFARTVVADRCGVAFQATFGPNKTRPTSSDSSPATIADENQLLNLWEFYDMFWKTGGMDKLAESDFDALGASATERLQLITTYHQCLSEALEGHTFFVTKRHFVGLAPLMTKEGDHIALIDSLSTPVVLRHVEFDLENSGFMILGPCYLHGVMYGQTQPGSKEEFGELAAEGEYICLL